MKRRRRLFVALGFGLALGAVVTVSLWRAPDRESDRYSWDTLSRGDIRETLVASGEIQARTRVNVGTSVMGEIKALHVKDGQNVEAGALLVTIDQERLRQERSRAEALLEGQRKDAARQEAAMRKSQETFRRFDELFRQGLISEEDHRQAGLNRESAELGVAVARATVQQGQANLAAMRDALSKSVLRAPIAGRVTGLRAEKGETAIPGTSNLPGAVLMVISDMSSLMAEIKVNESEVVRLRPGQIAQVTAESFPGRVFPGKVHEVASAAERIGQDANLYRVKVSLDMTAVDVSKLRPGMSARAVVLTSEVKGALRVPLQAVLEREGSLEDAQKMGLLSPESRSVAFVLVDGRARERSVKTGIANTQFYEVKEGLAAGERVLTGPIRRLKELKDDPVVKTRKKSDAQTEEEARRRKGPQAVIDVVEPFEAALRALGANKLRSALTTLGIIIGVAAVIVVVSLIGALERIVLREIERMGSQTLFVRPVLPGDMPPDEFAKLRDRDLTLPEMRALEVAVPQIAHVTPLFFSGTALKANGRSAGVGLIMTDDSFVELGGVNLQAGRNFVPADLRLRSKVIIVGPRILEKLAITGSPIGRLVQTPALTLEIIGVLEEQGATLGGDPDSNALIPLSTGLAMLSDQQRRQLMFQVRIDPRISADDGADLVREGLRRVKGLRAKEHEGFQVFSPKQITSIIGKITGWITAVAGGMVSIALVVGGIGIMNIMLVSVTERTREIGIRKAVGARRRDVLLQFLIEASLLSAFGGAIGIATGYAMGAALGRWLVGAVGLIPLWAVVSAFAVPAAIGVIFGLYPAAKASRLDPVEALRYE